MSPEDLVVDIVRDLKSAGFPNPLVEGDIITAARSGASITYQLKREDANES